MDHNREEHLKSLCEKVKEDDGFFLAAAKILEGVTDAAMMRSVLLQQGLPVALGDVLMRYNSKEISLDEARRLATTAVLGQMNS